MYNVEILDRQVSEKWLTALEQCTKYDEDQPQRLRCLKLLLVVLNEGYLVGPFKEAPLMVAGAGCMPSFDDDIHLVDINRLLADEANRTPNGRRTYHFSMSGSMHNFVAYQDIPNFGSHFYFGYSAGETVHEWSHPPNDELLENKPPETTEMTELVLHT